jgi:GDP-D-mannose dehydratase
MVGRADPIRAEHILGWKAKKFMPDIVRLMIEVEQKKIPVCSL